MKRDSSVSPADAPPSRPQPVSSVAPPTPALEVLQRAAGTSVLWMSVLMLSGGVVSLAVGFDAFPALQAFGVIASTVLIGIALFMHGRPEAPRLAVAALVLQTTTVVSTAAQSNARTSSSIGIFLTAFFVIVILPRRASVSALVLLCALWIVVVSPNEMPIELWGRVLNARWMTLPQLAISAAWLWRVWYPELDVIGASDAQEQASYGGLVESLLAQERLAAWRASAVRTHETTLNDIRYVLSSPTIDGAQLRDLLTRRPGETNPVGAADRPLRDVIGAAVEASGTTHATWTADRTRVTPRLAQAIRTVLVELLRNASRHGRARVARVSAWTRHDAVVLKVEHDSEVREDGGPQGIGLAIAVKETVAAAGGEVFIQGTSITVTLPRRAPAGGIDFPALATQRLVLSATMAGNAVGGIGNVVLLALVGTAVERVAAVLAVVGISLGGWTAARRGAPHVAAVALAAALAATVPLLVRSESDCSRLGLATTVSTLTLYGMTAVLLWAPTSRMWLFGAAGALGMYVLSASVPVACSDLTESPLLAASAAPIMLLVAWWTSRLALQQAQRRRELALEGIAQDAAAQASGDAAVRLHDSVTAATSIMLGIAHAGAATESERRTLRCLDSTIRASVQVDPESAGGFSLLADSIVQDAARSGIPTRVLTLRDSGDSRAVPDSIAAVAKRLVNGDPQGVATVQVLTSPGEDTLLVSTTVDSARRAHLTAEWQAVEDDCIAELDIDEESHVAALIVRRHVSAGP